MRRPIRGRPPWLSFPKEAAPVWFHCASGEFEYAKPVIRLLKQQKPQIPILVTYFSPSVERSLKNTPEVDYFCPMPWDQARHWEAFIKHHKPRALLIARTDLWPMMLATARRQKVPRLLFSKTVNPNKNALQLWLSQQLMPLLNDIFCVSPQDRDQLLRSLHTHKTGVHSAGDTRYDQCIYRLQRPRPLKILKNFYQPTLVAGSTWPTDEAILLPVIEANCNNVAFILAPHEPTKPHIEQLQNQLKKLNIESCLYSQVSQWHPAQVLIVDQVGILADLYAWGDMAFVGGSMGRSVHSVMEPLAHGLLTCVGPNHQNNREAMEFKEKGIQAIRAVQVVHRAENLHEIVQTQLPLWTANHKDQLQFEIRKKMGASTLVMKWLEDQGALQD